MDGIGEYRRLEGIHCPACSGPYHLIRILGRYGRSYKLLVRCPSCNIYGIGTAQAVNAPKVPDAPLAASAGSPTRPAPPPHSHEPVTHLDVSAMREFLRGFDGDFHSLWANRGEG